MWLSILYTFIEHVAPALQRGVVVARHDLVDKLARQRLYVQVAAADLGLGVEVQAERLVQSRLLSCPS